MAEPASTALAALTSTMAGVPAPVQTSFFAALSKLLGGVAAIPAAWLKRQAQAIEDVTVARSAVAAVLAKSVAEGTLQDPVAMQAAAEIYLPTAIRKARNRVQIGQVAAEQLADAIGAEATSNAEVPDDDWMNSFMRFAEDASSERLQDLFGRILAGQIVRPGSFSPKTLRLVSEMDQLIATDFSAAWAKSVGEAVPYGPQWERGEGLGMWKRLAEAGLMAETPLIHHSPPYFPVQDNLGAWTPMEASGARLTIFFPENGSASWRQIMFTRSARELGSVLARPDFEANMREVGQLFATQGATRVVLYRQDGSVETVHRPGHTPEP